MQCTHQLIVKQKGRLKIWDDADGQKCIILRSGLRGNKSRVRFSDGKSFEVPSDWLDPLDIDDNQIGCKCPWSMLIRGCECGAI